MDSSFVESARPLVEILRSFICYVGIFAYRSHPHAFFGMVDAELKRAAFVLIDDNAQHEVI